MKGAIPALIVKERCRISGSHGLHLTDVDRVAPLSVGPVNLAFQGGEGLLDQRRARLALGLATSREAATTLALPALAQVLKDPQAEVRIEVLLALRHFDHPKIFEVLRRVAETDTDRIVRARALEITEVDKESDVLHGRLVEVAMAPYDTTHIVGPSCTSHDQCGNNTCFTDFGQCYVSVPLPNHCETTFGSLTF